MTLITSHRAVDKAIYSALVILSAIKLCMEDFHKIGQPMYIITKSVQECADIGSLEERCFHAPAQSASTKHSKPRDLSGLKTKPDSWVRSK